jgi:hypothetical protein
MVPKFMSKTWSQVIMYNVVDFGDFFFERLFLH